MSAFRGAREPSVLSQAPSVLEAQHAKSHPEAQAIEGRFIDKNTLKTPQRCPEMNGTSFPIHNTELSSSRSYSSVEEVSGPQSWQGHQNHFIL
jgi:hypothetical protein